MHFGYHSGRLSIFPLCVPGGDVKYYNLKIETCHIQNDGVILYNHDAEQRSCFYSVSGITPCFYCIKKKKKKFEIPNLQRFQVSSHETEVSGNSLDKRDKR